MLAVGGGGILHGLYTTQGCEGEKTYWFGRYSALSPFFQISIDEQIIGFKGRWPYRVVIKSKPTPVGIKVRIFRHWSVIWWHCSSQIISLIVDQVYAVAEGETGYNFGIEIYAAQHYPKEDEGENNTYALVWHLLEKTDCMDQGCIPVFMFSHAFSPLFFSLPPSHTMCVFFSGMNCSQITITPCANFSRTWLTERSSAQESLKYALSRFFFVCHVGCDLDLPCYDFHCSMELDYRETLWERNARPSRPWKILEELMQLCTVNFVYWSPGWMHHTCSCYQPFRM